ncbi:MAG: 7-cyano-7-deazaguanine synthase QueC [Candidatus Cloacimonetes bacterium]|jgi:7-cyano-7-deazaguanine synthase|nr:7-cyano-7-deazaguanine synthase QueC [Candidatus Cloacimonadota bacterium]MDY0336957.1 7-cyano-7-deazaguanine synthase QueC [Candidatus Cloacimonadaceae bacterium]MCB5268718.1 7-cyano-7-deazaguanine synthase QueC [Candidatus Cloacimonadota bacterium]MCK9334709.1 7-cyano-7-deazaguanine synthase QueC [Candidatus Cloacimonadota bacterium]MDD3096345.1 7-cyano-7-deazaguanine synthase QueC [Candidatus Cloacimonadota bacterium]
MKRAIVLVSGGMDSLYTTAVAARDCDELLCLHFSYGQLTQDKERSCFEAIARHYQARETKIVDYLWLSRIGGSALTDGTIPIKADPEGIPNTYVPFRNATMLCAAIAWAEVNQAERIYIGAVEEDGSGYPDCRESFFDAMENLIQEGTKARNIRIYTPVLHMSKKDIIIKGLTMRVPFELSWSCYIDSEQACGECPSCKLRLKAFKEAGMIDPITYREKL